MQLTIGGSDFDVQRRPLVIARIEEAPVNGSSPVTAAKDAVGRGADLVALPAPRCTAEVADALGGIAVAIATTAAELAVVPEGSIAAAWWRGAGPFPDRGDSRPERVRLCAAGSAGDGVGWRRGDGRVVGPDALGDLGASPDGVFGLVDLSGVTGRALLAAWVTVALESGASGFITSVPSAVRRAAHVIRAVEHAT